MYGEVARMGIIADNGYMAGERYATIHEVALELRCSDEHIRQMCLSGAIPSIRVGAAWRIPRRGLRDVIKKSRQSGDVAAHATAGNQEYKTG